MKEIYYLVNTELAFETAKKAKNEGVKHFIFMSSMIVYGSKEEKIHKNTIPNPDNFYGKSKLEAEKLIQSLEDEGFKLTILRPPMIYGPNSKGNFSKLIKFSKNIIFFPRINNRRSILYIENLANVIHNVISKRIYGILFPQDNEYMNTSFFVKRISSFYEKKVILVKIFNIFIRVLSKKVILFNKIFSDFYYTKELSNMTSEYCIFNHKTSIEKCLREDKKNV